MRLCALFDQSPSISIANIIQLHLTRVQTMLQLVKQITAAGASLT